MSYEVPLMLPHPVMGPDRIMFAVVYPLEENEEPVRAMGGALVRHEDKPKVYQANAERAFNLSAG